MKPLEEQLDAFFDFRNPTYKNLHMPTNDAFEIVTSNGHFAFKLYNPSSRTLPDVRWEIDLTLHLVNRGVPVAKPIAGKEGYLHTYSMDGEKRVGVLFEWADGEKPMDSEDTYHLIGKAAAQFHAAADSFSSDLPREKYDAAVLIDEQLERMKEPLIATGQWQCVYDLGERMKELLADTSLDHGICHMDLKPDNVHRKANTITVFDLDSAAECWRAIEPYRVLRLSKDYFVAWLDGYRSIRPFQAQDEKAVAAFGIIAEFRDVVWKLGYARSSRGKPLLKAEDLPGIIDGWLAWERDVVG